MAEVDISPLAKRLAEENNVDWRALRGTGDDGRIVERDVLDFLARVMAGDEAADPTPEPLPEGLEEWPDGPPMAGGSAGRPQTPARPSETDSWESGDDDLLEVETAGSSDAGSSTSDDWARGDWGNDDWGADGGTGSGPAEGKDDYFAGIGDLGANDQATGKDGGIDFGGDDDGQSFGFGSETEGQGFDFGGDAADEDSSFGFDASPQAAFDTSSLEPAIDEGIFVFDDEDDVVAAAPAVTPQQPAADEEQFEFGGEEQDVARAATTVEVDTEHTPWEGGSASASEVEEEVAASTRTGESPWEQEGDAETSDLPASDAPWTAVAEEEPFVHAATEMPAPPVSTAGGEEYAYLDRADESLPDGVRIEEDEYRVVRSAAEGAAATATMSRTESARPASGGTLSGGTLSGGNRGGLVGSGIVLRRDVDLTAIAEARQALSAELVDHGSLAAFLVRAAVRAGKPWPLAGDGDQVGLATLSDDGISVSVIDDASTIAFRDLVRSCSEAGSGDGKPSLAVADVSELGIDEAVLDLGYPVLTVGRVIEDSAGRFHATLTLSGIGTPDSGSKFLGRVAELLAAPVRLVL